MSNHVVKQWEGMLQILVQMVGRDYEYFSRTLLPEQKEGQWRAIDAKLIAKFGAERSKFARCRRKAAGRANAVYLRWGAQAYVLCTKGDMSDLPPDEKLNHLSDMPIPLMVGDLTFHIHRRGGNGCATETFRAFKDRIHRAVTHKNRKEVVEIFKRLHGIPAWGGVIEQGIQLSVFAHSQAKRAGLRLSRADTRVRTLRKVVRVYENG